MDAPHRSCPHCGSDEIHPFIKCPASLDYFAAGEVRAPQIEREPRVGDPERPAEGKGISAASLHMAAEKLAGPIWGLAKTGISRFKEGHVVWSLDLTRQLIRAGETIVLNLSQAVFQNDDSQNPILDDGDLVYIPPLSTSSRRIMMLGEVGQPGLLELPSEVRVAEAIARSGGFTQDAHLSKVVVVRGGLDEPILLAANFKSLIEGDLSQNFLLKDGDLVFVARRALSNFRDVMSVFSAPLSFLYTGLLIREVGK